MRTYYIPSLITLSAGAVYCLVAIRNHLTLRETLTELLIVVIVFYLAGSVVKFIIDRNFKDMELDENPEESGEEDNEEGQEPVDSEADTETDAGTDEVEAPAEAE